MIVKLEEEFRIFSAEKGRTELHYKGLVIHIHSTPYQLIDAGDVYLQKHYQLKESGFVDENGYELIINTAYDPDSVDETRLISKCFTQASDVFYRDEEGFQSLKKWNKSYARKWNDQAIGVLRESGYWLLCQRDTGEWFLWIYEPNSL
jgi:hypothetical protein